MAEGLWNFLGNGDWKAVSAGSNPAGYVHPMALRALEEAEIPLPEPRSKHLEEFLATPFDVVVTVCDNAQEACPTFPGTGQVFHWPFEDPAHAVGTDDEKMAFFRKVRDQIRDRISSYLAEQKA